MRARRIGSFGASIEKFLKNGLSLLLAVLFQPPHTRMYAYSFAIVPSVYFPMLPSCARISLMGGISPMFVRTESAIPATMMVSTS